MLAYVFWHWPLPEVQVAEYQARLREFHESLRAHAPAGFLQSASFRITGAPWTPVAEAYEDWYLIEDFAALGALNEASIAGARKQPHDSAARLAAGGVGGVYQMLFGKTNPFDSRLAQWFSKPTGMTYTGLRSKVEHLEEADNSLWQRQLVLGPTPEFCLRGKGDARVDLRFSPLILPVTLVLSFE